MLGSSTLPHATTDALVTGVEKCTQDIFSMPFSVLCDPLGSADRAAAMLLQSSKQGGGGLEKTLG